MTSFRLSTAALCAVGLSLCLASPVASVYAADAPGAKAPMTLSEAEGVLRNTSFYDRWSVDGALDSPKTAERVRAEAETHLSTVEKAVNIVRSACYERFFVNSCIDDARKLSFLRQREIRSVMLAADEMVRLDRAERAREGKGKEPTPIQLQHRPGTASSPTDRKPATPKAPAEPMNIRPAKVKAPSAPTDIKPAEVKEAGAPERIPGAKSEPNAPKDREAMEAANEAWYAQKQREAAERERQTQERIEKNRRDREAKQANLKRQTEERQAAQKRYEERQQHRESGLAKYF